MAKHYNFKANIRLKDIVGQKLIHNSNIAIIELIKNAIDAGSKKIFVTFKDATTKSPQSKIIIQDFGKGMSRDDIDTKWLNIAYSEKKQANRNDRKVYAGEHGVGRFSCDRLGSKLKLFTQAKNDQLLLLPIDWSDFEIDDQEKQIGSVNLKIEPFDHKKLLEDTVVHPFTHGTCLIIEGLREVWGERELRRLQKELERFILAPEKSLSIHLKSFDIKDSKGELTFDGAIENKLFSKLDDKTISIRSEITASTDSIKTALFYYGDQIFSFEEENTFSQLSDIKVAIHYLNSQAKITFKSITGYLSFEYGSVMLFRNGFRVMPYGEPKDDWLRLNQRKNQGNRRYLGAREVFGLVQITDDDNRFPLISSREGLENTPAFRQLANDEGNFDGYIQRLISVLEKFVIQGFDWDRAIEDHNADSVSEIEQAVQSVVEAFSKRKLILKVSVNTDRIKAIAREKAKQYKDFVSSLSENLSDKTVYELTPSDKRNLKNFVIRHDARISDIKQTSEEYRTAASVEKKRRLFAESHLTNDSQRVSNMVHLIGLWGGPIQSDLESLLKDISRGQELNIAKAIEVIKSSYFRISKINKLSHIITKANFDLMSDHLRYNIFAYIQEYVEQIDALGAAGWKIKISFQNTSNARLDLNMSPLEVSMLVDNIISNAAKANASRLDIIVGEGKKNYYVKFIDNGDGLSTKYKPTDLFEAGVTTTKGSGIGLYHVRSIASDLDATVSIDNHAPKGACVEVEWPK